MFTYKTVFVGQLTEVLARSVTRCDTLGTNTVAAQTPGQRKTMNRLLLIAFLFLSGCTGLPKGVEPIEGFELQRYLGTWYEIARLDHRFERGLSRVTANYTARADGGVTVTNRGYSDQRGFKEASGRAYFVGESSTGHLKVSFFGPFYGSYVIFNLDSDYQQAFISGYNKKFLWLLSRTPTVEPATVERFKAEVLRLGFDVSGLILVDQSPIE